MGSSQSKNLKRRVAREAAALLYTSQEKEYKQAKVKAAQTLGARVLPSNLEVAEELDKVAEEREGSSRRERLLQMRKEALQIMRRLMPFHPRLVGSVWRGTAHRNSDIDVLTFSSDPNELLKELQKGDFTIERTEWSSVTKEGRKKSAFHIHLVLPSGNKAEIVVRSPERMNVVESCETYGDRVTGLNYSELERVLRKSPYRKFVPT